MGAFPDGPEPGKYDFSTVRLLGSVVSPSTRRRGAGCVSTGGGTASFIDTWWQSETGSTVCSPAPARPGFRLSRHLPGGTRTTPCPVALPAPFRRVHRVVDEHGNPVEPGKQGFIVVDKIGPSMARTVWKNPRRFLDSYWRHYGERGWFLAGDGAKEDEETCTSSAVSTT